MNARHEDVHLILKLYELRREPAMRQARAWYFTQFNPKSPMDIVNLLLSGEEQSAKYRMITSYWDMAASFVNNGGIDEKMFLEANTEHIAIFTKLEPFLEGVREILGAPDYLKHLEVLVSKVPYAQERLVKVRGILQKWATAENQ